MALLDKLTSGSSTPPDTSGMSKQAKLVCELVADFNSNNLLIEIDLLAEDTGMTIVPKATLIKHTNIPITSPVN